MESAASLLPQADPVLASVSDESKWLGESFNLAKSDAYKSPVIGDTRGTITAAYKANAENIAKKRIALAGARLANLLDDAFK